MKRTLLLSLGCLATLALVVTACGGSQNCDGVGCSGHGRCELVSGAPTCICDEGFEAVGLTCEPGGGNARMGEDCSDSSECQSGWCLKFTGDDLGYCSLRDCTGPDACTNYSDDGAEMCCVDVGGEFFICEKIVPGYACGTQDKMCGASCAGQIDSACHPSQACLMAGMEDPNATCAHECSTDADCADCSDPEEPATEFVCTPISGGVTYCLEAREDGCNAPADCPEGEACIPFVDADGTSIVPQCGAFGDVETGEVCDEDADPPDCIGAYCFDDHCSESCTFDTDCPENMVCGTLIFCVNPPTCSETTDPTGACFWKEGSMDLCGGDADCPTGEYCDFHLEFGGNEVAKFCVNKVCDVADAACADYGEDCSGDNIDCYNGMCFTGGGETTCGAACDDDADCPAGNICGLVNLGDGYTTGTCTEDNTCSSGADCDPGDFCLPTLMADNSLGGSCGVNGTGGVTGDACADDDACASGYCFDGFCSEVCTVDGDCPAGAVCAGILFGGIPPDNGTALLPMCQWFPGSNDPCTGNTDCQAGEYCDLYFIDESSYNKVCLTENCDPLAGPPDCTRPPGDCANDEVCWGFGCVNNGTDFWCSSLCELSTDCPVDMICTTVGLSDTATAGGCSPFDGSAAPCTTNADCPGGEACTFVGTYGAGTESLCATEVAGGGAPGEACDGATPCANDLCLTPGDYCSAVCATNADCTFQVGGNDTECNYIGLGGEDYGSACTDVGAESPLCSLCTTDADCVGDAECLTPTPPGETPFCGLPCPVGDECPEGTTCTPGTTVDQCVPDTGSCVPVAGP